ncbi:MAG TPA: hypothetical protein VKX25_06605 [Bryobacteraceae bacterium]|jgi:VWFA-related protein|nr:hypothetical protein [Bryobacteraceae bacterium]
MSCPGRLGIVLLAVVLVLGQSPVVRVPVRLVVVPTLVLSRAGRVITGLEADKFEVFDNGRAQKFSLESGLEAASAVIAIQANEAMRDYLPFVVKTGSVVEDLLLGADGKAAVLSYADDVEVVRGFGPARMKDAFAKLSAAGRDAHMLDAAERGIEMLETEPAGRARVLLLIGQPYDQRSARTFASVAAHAGRANVQIYALVLPLAGKKFVADTFHFPDMSSQKGGVAAGVELTSLIPTLLHGAKSMERGDPFSQLVARTGGMQIHFRKQAQLEDALIVMGTELRSTYSLTYTPNSTEPGYHSIRVVVKVPGAIAYSRTGYEF